MIDLKMAKLNADNCGPCEFVLLSVSADKSREFYCKTDTPENRTTWGGVLQTVINRLIEGRATFHGKPFFSPLPVDARTSAPEQASSVGNTPRATSTTSDSSDAAPPSPASGSSFNPYAGPNSASSSTGQQSTPPYGQPYPAATNPRASDIITANHTSSSSPNLAIGPRASMAIGAAGFGSPGPMVQFNPVGGQEIVRVFLPDQSSKTILFDTTQSVSTLAQQVLKKLGTGNYSNYCLFAFTLGEIYPLSPDASVISQVMQWPTKNDPEHYRLVFQPEQESDRERASTVGFLDVKTSANAHSNVQKSSSFVSQVMGAVRSKPEWTGNITLASVPTPYLHRGTLSKKSTSITGGSKDILAIATETAFYFFDAGAQPQDKSKGWVPLEKSALYKDRGPLSFTFYYIHPGTLDQSSSLDVNCRTEDEKKAWIAVLEPRCKGTLPTKVKPPQRRTGSSPSVAKPKESSGPPADVGAMLETTPSEGPKLVHLTAGRPKGAGKRPPTARPKTAAPSPLNPIGPLSTGSGDFSSSSPFSFSNEPYNNNASSAPLSSESTGYGSAPSSTATASTETPNSTPGSTPNGSLVTPGAVSPRIGQPSYPPSSAPPTAAPPTAYNNNMNYNAGYNNGGYPNTAGGYNTGMGSSPSQAGGGYMQPSGGSNPSLYAGTSPRPVMTNSGNSPRLNGSSGAIPPGSPSSPRVLPTASPRPGFAPPATPGGPPSSTPPMPAVTGPPPTSNPYNTAPASNPYNANPSPYGTMPAYTPPTTTPAYTSPTASPFMLQSPTTTNPQTNAGNASNPYASSYQAPVYNSAFSNPAIIPPGSPSSTTPARPIANPTPLSGPNPAQFQTVPPPGSPSPVLSPPGLAHPGQQFSNPALNNTAPQKPNMDTEADVLDIKSLLGYGSPALPKQQAFPAYTSPHISGPPLAPAKGSTIMYSPVLAMPMPIVNTSPAADTRPLGSTPYNSGASTTISISGPPHGQQPAQPYSSPFTTVAPSTAPPSALPPSQPLVASSGTISLTEAPTPVLMDLLNSPQMDLSSPFDDIPFE